jgi:micrococcal nuclease
MYQYKATLIKVVDGDTVDAMIDCGFSTFKKERIRLYGINAPESRTRDKEEKKRGLAAKARLKELIKEGKNEFIVETSMDKKGKYGRLLGKIFPMSSAAEAKVKSYNQILLDEGHAVIYDGGKR